MRVAVTGASGFIGRAVIPRLLARGADVVAVSRREAVGAPSERLRHCVLDLSVPRSDVFDQLGRPDVLVHLAWDGLPNYRAARHLDEELPRQIAFLDRCIEQGLARLVVAGTCLEYGLQQGCLAEDRETAPTTAYAQAKDALRRHLQSVPHAETRVTWLRLFYLYGEGQAPTSLYSLLRAAIARGDATFAMSRGDQVRDFQPIADAAEQIVTAALHPSGEGVFNICSGRPVAVVDLVQQWLRDWNARIELDRGVYDYPDYEPHAFWGDRRRFDALLGNA
jgi:nucleoside-diphosphate-sugar epimerase